MTTWRIDWKELMAGYNRIHKTRYRYLDEFILGECNKMTGVVFAEKLGVSVNSLDRIKRELGITKTLLGVVPKKDKILNLAKSGKVKNMTALEIAEYADASMNYVYHTLQDGGFDFRRLWVRHGA